MWVQKCDLCGEEKNSEKTAFVYCTNCGANGKMIEISPKYGADEKAIEAWNRRVNEDAPTADIVERKRGEWKDYPIADGCVQCSSCGVLRMGEPLSFFCPWCGADMRGGGENVE